MTVNSNEQALRRQALGRRLQGQRRCDICRDLNQPLPGSTIGGPSIGKTLYHQFWLIPAGLTAIITAWMSGRWHKNRYS
jgi:hypothetical protein